MRKIKSQEIRELKKITRAQRDEITQLNARINELETQLVESRAKEGMGVLETTINTFCEMIGHIGDALSEMSPDEIKFIASRHCNIMDADCPDDCDFDCEHCDHAKIKIEEDGDT